MKGAKLQEMLAELKHALLTLYEVVSNRFPEYSRYWGGLIAECQELENSSPTKKAIAAFGEKVGRSFGMGMGSFSETGLWHTDYNERVRLNLDFQARKQRVSGLAGALIDAARDGEVNMLAVRRRFTEVETVLLNQRCVEEATRVRALLNADELDETAAIQLCNEWETKQWRGDAARRVPALLREIEDELRHSAPVEE